MWQRRQFRQALKRLFLTRPGKEALENHFDVNFELEYFLERKGKKENLKVYQKRNPKKY